MIRIAERFRAGKAIFVLAVAALLLGACYDRGSPVTNGYAYDNGYTYGYGDRYNYPNRYGRHRSYYRADRVYGHYFGHRSRQGRKHH